MLFHQLPEASRVDMDLRAYRRRVSMEVGRRWSSEGVHNRRQSSAHSSWFRSTSLRSETLEEERNSQSDEITFGKLPPVHKRTKADNVFKLCQEEWQHRYVCCSEENLTIALPGSCDISDRIPLHEIRAVTKVKMDGADVPFQSSTIYAFNVHTVAGGYNCGREYCFGVTDPVGFEEWTTLLSKLSKSAAKRVANRTLFESYQNRARNLASSTLWKHANSFMLAANLVVIVVQAQLLPAEGTTAMSIFDCLDVVFTVSFTLELSVHLFAYWLRPFISDGWFIFDLFVVIISLSALIFKNLPGITVLRLMRTVRVLRLFNRLRSLRTLINSVAASFFPVLNAFVMVLLVCVVYAILGVELFNDNSPEYFGNFFLSYWTMFEISTTDSWTQKAKDLSSDSSDGVDPIVACFMSSFIVVVTWVLLPVVVAVLLDNFIRAVAIEKLKAIEEEEEAAMSAKGVSKAVPGNPLEPLLESLSRFKSSVLDVDACGTLDFGTIQEGLKKIDNLKSRIHLSNDDYCRMTNYGSLCNNDGRLDKNGFHEMLCNEIDTYAYHKVSNAYDESLLDERSDSAAILAGLKILLHRSIPSISKSNQDREAISECIPNLSSTADQNKLFMMMQDLKVLQKQVLETNLNILKMRTQLSYGYRCVKCKSEPRRFPSDALDVKRHALQAPPTDVCITSERQNQSQQSLKPQSLFVGDCQFSAKCAENLHPVGSSSEVRKNHFRSYSDSCANFQKQQGQGQTEFYLDEISCVNPPLLTQSSESMEISHILPVVFWPKTLPANDPDKTHADYVAKFEDKTNELIAGQEDLAPKILQNTLVTQSCSRKQSFVKSSFDKKHRAPEKNPFYVTRLPEVI